MSRNCSSRRLTSLIGRPAPRATRARREPFMTPGCLRSRGVIDSTIASTCFMRLGSADLICLSIFVLTPGSIFNSPSSGPSFSIWRIAVRKSLRSMPSFRTFFSRRFASSASKASCAFSTKVTTSPCCRMRLAIRSGWNSSSASGFSPTPMYLIGFLVTP